MRAVLFFIVLIVFILLIGSLLAYPLYVITSSVTDISFDKYVHYSILLTGLALCLAYIKQTKSLGHLYGSSVPIQSRWKYFLISLTFGITLLLVIESLLFFLGMRTLDPRLASGGASGFGIAILKGLITGIVVGLIEETIYRGAIFTGLKKYANTVIAILCSSLFYAGVHFIEFTELPGTHTVTLLDGPAMLSNGFYLFADPLIYDSFVSLFLLGVLFCLARLWIGNLIACIGLHAGIVATIKVLNYSTDYQTGSEYEFLINHYDKLNGWLASSCLLISCLLVYIMMMKKGPPLQQ